MPIRAALGAVIRARRLELGWTQEELAARISADGEYLRQSEISRIESGKIALPRRERLERIATALDVPLGELLARSGWAGAEPYFQPTATDLTVSPVQRESSSGSGDSPNDPEAGSTVDERTMKPADARVRSRIPSYDPDAMAAFREALAAMREGSERLQRNRITASEMQRLFIRTTGNEPSGTVAGNYANGEAD